MRNHNIYNYGQSHQITKHLWNILLRFILYDVSGITHPFLSKKPLSSLL